MRRLNWKQILALTVTGVAIIVLFGKVLGSVDGWFTSAMKRNESIYTYLNQVTGLSWFGPIFDSSTEIFQIIAQLLMTWAFAEQWPLWIINNVITIAMWIVVAIADPTMIPMATVTCVMWIGYLVNSGYGWIVWKRGAAKC